jgi:hypothetical protein
MAKKKIDPGGQIPKTHPKQVSKPGGTKKSY